MFKKALLLTFVTMTLSACGDKNPSGSSTDGSAGEISAIALTAMHWCQTSNEPMGSGGSIPYSHRLVFNPKGSIKWQAFAKSDGMEMKQNSYFTCRDESSQKLKCYGGRDADFFVTYKVTKESLDVYSIKGCEWLLSLLS